MTDNQPGQSELSVQSLEKGLRVIEKGRTENDTPTRHVYDQLKNEQQKSADGRVRTLNLKEPSRVINTEGKAIPIFDSQIKARAIDAASGKAIALTREQVIFTDQGHTLIKTMFELRDNDFNFDLLDPVKQKMLITIVGRQLQYNESWRALRPKFDITNPSDQDDVAEYIRNPYFKEVVLPNFIKQLSSVKVNFDYTGLGTILEEQHKIQTEMAKMKSEIPALRSDLKSLELKYSDYQEEKWDARFDATGEVEYVKVANEGKYSKDIKEFQREIDVIESNARQQVRGYDTVLKIVDQRQNDLVADPALADDSKWKEIEITDPRKKGAKIVLKTYGDFLVFVRAGGQFADLKQKREERYKIETQPAEQWKKKKKFLEDQRDIIQKQIDDKNNRLKEIDKQVNPNNNPDQPDTLFDKDKKLQVEIDQKQEEADFAEAAMLEELYKSITDSAIDGIIWVSRAREDGFKGAMDSAVHDYFNRKVWNGRRVNMGGLKKMLDQMKDIPPEQWGDKWQATFAKNFINDMKRSGSMPPDVREYLTDISTSNDTTKLDTLKKFGEQRFLEMCQFIALKDPKALELTLGRDRSIAMGLKNHTLPKLLEQAKNNPEMSAKISEVVGVDITEIGWEGWKDKLDSNKFMTTLLAILSIVVGGGAAYMLSPLVGAIAGAGALTTGSLATAAGRRHI